MIGSPAKNACRGKTGQRRGARRGFRLGLERLDQRLACAGLSIAVASPPVVANSTLEVEMVTPTTNIQVSTLPADLTTEPAFALRFNHPLNSFSTGTQDFTVRQVNSDGTISPLLFNTSKPNETLDPNDPTSQTLVVSMVTPLDPGTYQLVLAGNSSLSGSQRESPSPSDQVLNTFQVGTGGMAAGETLDVGTVSSAASEAFFTVGTSAATAPLNKVTLGPGNVYAFASTFDDQDPDNYQINLYNSQQRLIDSASGSNLESLNDDLAPGTYFVQVVRTSSPDASPPGSLGIDISGTSLASLIPAVNSLVAVNFNHDSTNPTRSSLGLRARPCRNRSWRHRPRSIPWSTSRATSGRSPPKPTTQPATRSPSAWQVTCLRDTTRSKRTSTPLGA